MAKPLPPPDQMPLDTPQLGEDGAHYVLVYVEDAPGLPTEIPHRLGRIPYCLQPVWSNKAINLPEVVSSTKESSIVKFIPDWVSVYSSRKFLVLMRVQ